MWLFVVPILLSAASTSQEYVQPKIHSAATDAQIRFAVENKYDQTGPGAKGRELAYNTYKTLDEALIGYLNDPDTKLPEFERAKATQKLYELQRPPFTKERLRIPNFVSHDPHLDTRLLHTKEYHGNLAYLQSLGVEKLREDPFRMQKIQAVKNSPLNLAHFTRGPSEVTNEFNPHPKYSFSYGVHDKLTGDSKSAQESRDGQRVHGFYSFKDADGQQRVVQYSADDEHGFRALVRRTAPNQ